MNRTNMEELLGHIERHWSFAGITAYLAFMQRENCTKFSKSQVSDAWTSDHKFDKRICNKNLRAWKQITGRTPYTTNYIKLCKFEFPLSKAKSQNENMDKLNISERPSFHLFKEHLQNLWQKTMFIKTGRYLNSPWLPTPQVWRS